jgi:hypothetical protein
MSLRVKATPLGSDARRTSRRVVRGRPCRPSAASRTRARRRARARRAARATRRARRDRRPVGAERGDAVRGREVARRPSTGPRVAPAGRPGGDAVGGIDPREPVRGPDPRHAGAVADDRPDVERPRHELREAGPGANLQRPIAVLGERGRGDPREPTSASDGYTARARGAREAAAGALHGGPRRSTWGAVLPCPGHGPGERPGSGVARARPDVRRRGGDRGSTQDWTSRIIASASPSNEKRAASKGGALSEGRAFFENP